MIVTQTSGRNLPRREELPTHTIIRLDGNLLEARKWEFLELPPAEREEVVDDLFASDDLERNVDLLVTELDNVLEEIQPDVIHAHSTYVVFNRVLETMREHYHIQTPLVLTVHGLPKPLILPSGENTTDYEQLATHCPFDVVYGVSKHVTASLEKHLRSDIRIEAMYLGVDAELFSPGEDYGSRWDLVFAGRIEKVKGVDLFPDMLRLLSKKNPRMSMAITGAGSYEEQLRADLESTGTIDMVTFLGVVDWDDVPRAINSSQVFLYPSRREPFGLAIVEAMACERAVVSSDIFGPTEIITPNKDGMLVRPDDPRVLAETVWWLMTHERKRRMIGAAARQTVLQRFDIDRHVRLLLCKYEKMRDGVGK